jgi:opacity protein-like surface antigen
MTSRFGRALTLVVIFLILTNAASGLAQTRARVVRNDTIVWRLDAAIPVGKVQAGMVLEVVRSLGAFVEVIIPADLGGHGETGRVTRTAIEVIGPPPQPRTQSAARPSFVEPKIGLRWFGQAGVAVPDARDSFKADMGRAYGFAFGGGAQVRFHNGLFVEASFDQFRKTGERVFVFDGTVFPLGIPDTVTIRPLVFSAGYRFSRTRPRVPYVGGGIGTFQLIERTPFSDQSEEVRERYIGYRVLGGIEFRRGRRLAAAIEGAYTQVPDSLGIGGVSQVFREHDLGGFDARVKVLFGR